MARPPSERTSTRALGAWAIGCTAFGFACFFARLTLGHYDDRLGSEGMIAWVGALLMLLLGSLAGVVLGAAAAAREERGRALGFVAIAIGSLGALGGTLLTCAMIWEYVRRFL